MYLTFVRDGVSVNIFLIHNIEEHTWDAFHTFLNTKEEISVKTMDLRSLYMGAFHVVLLRLVSPTKIAWWLGQG